MRRYLAILALIFCLLACNEGSPEVALTEWRVDIVAPEYDEYLEVLILLTSEAESNYLSEITLQYVGDSKIWYFYPEQWTVIPDTDSDGAWVSLILAKPNREPFEQGLWKLAIQDKGAQIIEEHIYIQRSDSYVVEEREQYMPSLVVEDQGVRFQANGTLSLRYTLQGSEQILLEELQPGYYLWEDLDMYRYMQEGVLQQVLLSHNNETLGLTFTRRYDNTLQPIELP